MTTMMETKVCVECHKTAILRVLTSICSLCSDKAKYSVLAQPCKKCLKVSAFL